MNAVEFLCSLHGYVKGINDKSEDKLNLPNNHQWERLCLDLDCFVQELFNHRSK